MRLGRLVVGLALLVVAGSAQAASYLDIFGVVHDPIHYVRWERGGPVHDYSGLNLEPGVVVPGATLNYADLPAANLSGANLIDVFARRSKLFGADLSGAFNLGTVVGTVKYDRLTDFTDAWSGAYGTSTPFDPVAAGWKLPEPTTGLLLGLGLLGVALRRRV